MALSQRTSMQVNKYKLLKELPYIPVGTIFYGDDFALHRAPGEPQIKTARDIAEYLSRVNKHHTERGKWFTPLIESEPEMLEEDIETLANNLVWSNGTVKPGYLASTLSEIHKRLNALQKGSK